MRWFLVHDERDFTDWLCPALAASRRQQSFAPLAKLIDRLAGQVEAAAIRDHLTADEKPLFLRIAQIRFRRQLWRHVAGELLLYAAIETPAFPLAPEMLGQVLPVELVERVHRGSRELTFDGVPYRPDAAGFHDGEDVAELAATLTSIDTAAWSADRLTETHLEERDDELEYARQRFGDLRAMFVSASVIGQVIVCEEV